MNRMCVIFINNHLPHFSFMSLIYCYTTAGIAWLPQLYKKMLEQTCSTYNEVCIIIRQGLEHIQTFSSRPRPGLLFQDQDHFSCPWGTPRPRPRSRDYIPDINVAWMLNNVGKCRKHTVRRCQRNLDEKADLVLSCCVVSMVVDSLYGVTCLCTHVSMVWRVCVGLASCDTHISMVWRVYVHTSLWCDMSVFTRLYGVTCLCVGLASSDSYMKLAKEQEMERQSRRNKKLAKQRTSKSGKRRRHGATSAATDDHDDDVPVMHVVSTAVDAPEVALTTSPGRHWR